MALPPPEGIVWFERSVLKNKLGNPDDQKQFYDIALVEVVINRSFDEGYKGNDDPKLPYEDHPRAGKQVISYDATKYVRWQRMNCMLGPDAKNITRQHVWDATGDARDLQGRTKKYKVAYLPVPMPTVEERFLWIDLTFPVRAVYFPLAYYADRRAPKFAAYIQLNLRVFDLSVKTYTPRHVPLEKLSSNIGKAVGGMLGQATGIVGQAVGHKAGEVAQDFVDGQFIPGAQKDVPEPNLTEEARKKIEEKEGAPRTYYTGNLNIRADVTQGWSWRPQWTARIDVGPLMEMLIVPMHFRQRVYVNPYRYMKLFHATAINNSGVQKTTQNTMDPENVTDYAGLLSQHGGILLDYSATAIPKSSILQIIIGIATAKLSVVPVAGTVLSLGLGYLAEYLDDPQAMMTQHSLAKKGTEISLVLLQGAWSVRKYYASGKIPGITLPRRGPGMRRAYMEGDDRKPIHIGKDGEPDQSQEPVKDSDTVAAGKAVQLQIALDVEDDEEYQDLNAFGYTPFVIRKE